MKVLAVFCLTVVHASLSMSVAGANDELLLWDFTSQQGSSLADWSEQSDVAREPGKSKASFVLQKTKVFQRAVFFSLLNPQPNGAGFAGFRTTARTLDLSGYSAIQLRVRGQGQNSHYKVALYQNGRNDEPYPAFEQTFQVPLGEFITVNLPLDSFKPYIRGKAQNESQVGPLNLSEITSFGIQIFGGVYSPEKQYGASSLEIDYIKAVMNDGKILFDFTSADTSLADWSEQSDVAREPGKSKASFVLQKTKVFQRAVFFSLLNPQPNGAGFAGFRTTARTLDLSGYSAIQLRVRGQGQNSHYKIALYQNGQNDEPYPAFERKFNVMLGEFVTVTLPLDSFKPYIRGKPQDESTVGPLNKSDVTSFGIQIYGGVYSPEKQQGASSLEIDYVKAV